MEHPHAGQHTLQHRCRPGRRPLVHRAECKPDRADHRGRRFYITEYGDAEQRTTVLFGGPDGNLWFTEENADQIGEIVLSGNQTQPLTLAPRTAIPGMSRAFDLGVHGPGRDWSLDGAGELGRSDHADVLQCRLGEACKT